LSTPNFGEKAQNTDGRGVFKEAVDEPCHDMVYVLSGREKKE
jgi:hypothetical protein